MYRSAIVLILLTALPCLSAGGPPAWVRAGGADPGTYPASRYLTGYGIAGPGGTEAGQRQEAMAMAREAVAASIRTRVTSEFTSRVTQQGRLMSKFAQNLVSTRADLELEGLDTVLVWPDPAGGTTHALAVLDKPRTLALLEEKLRRQAQACAGGFERARAAGDAAGLLQARHVREAMEEGLVVRAVLGGPNADPACPDQAAIDGALRRLYAGRKGLDGTAATAALDLCAGLPRGIRVLVDRVTYADTPFRGSLSAWLEQALAAELVACGQVKLVDKAAGREAILAGGPDFNLAAALPSQAVVRGACFDLGEDVQLTFRVTGSGGEELAATTLRVPADAVRRAGLKAAPDNLEAASKALEICNAQVQDSRLKVKVALDRGDGGIYRKGDKLHLFLKSNMDCYVKVLYHQVDGSSVEIFPNAFHPEGRVQKDRLYQIPPDDNSFTLDVMEPFGVEFVKVMASTEPLETRPEAPGGLKLVREDLAALIGRTRGIGLKKAEAQYAEDTAVVNTLAK